MLEAEVNGQRELRSIAQKALYLLRDDNKLRIDVVCCLVPLLFEVPRSPFLYEMKNRLFNNSNETQLINGINNLELWSNQAE